MISAALDARCDLYAGRDEWLRARGRDYSIGASDVPAILGLSPYKGPWDVWLAKRAGSDLPEEDIAPDADDDDAVPDEDVRARGHLWEPWLRVLLARALGTPVLAPGEPWGAPEALVIVHHAALAWACMSPDGWLEHRGVVTSPELKTDLSRGRGWGRSGTLVIGKVTDPDEAPLRPDYLVQTCWQLEVLDAPVLPLSVLLGSYRQRWFTIQRDPAFGRHLLNTVAAWRERHLVNGEEPDPDGSKACVDYFREKWFDTSWGERAATPEEVPVLRAFGAARAIEAAARRSVDAVHGRVLAAFGAGKSITISDRESVTRASNGALRARGFLVPEAVNAALHPDPTPQGTP